jgi:hypothetical protein
MSRSSRVGMLRAGACVATIAFAGWASAADPQPAAKEPSKEMRAQMAQMHEAMAACLKSDQTVAACRNQMRAKYSGMMGHGHCGMMDEAVAVPK